MGWMMRSKPASGEIFEPSMGACVFEEHVLDDEQASRGEAFSKARE